MGILSSSQVLVSQYIVPLFLITATSATVQFLAWKGNPQKEFDPSIFLGNAYSAKFLLVSLVWATLFLIIPSKKFKGPPSKSGFVPVYQDNGFLYYLASMAAFLVAEYFFEISHGIFENFGEILSSLNIFAVVLCVFLWVKGKVSPTEPAISDEERLSIPLEFFRGLEVHPEMFNINIKQLTNCRIGLLLWQILILAFFFASTEKYGLKPGFLVNVSLQTIYLAKFYWWETGYFNTLDITMDRAGYYICWGCLVWVPCLYTFTSYYFVMHSPHIGNIASIIVFFLGVLFTVLNYVVDYEKELFKATSGKCDIWGKKATYIIAEYEFEGKTKKSKLMTAGFWGFARKCNYTFELLATFTWAVSGMGQGCWPFLYFLFLSILLVHRIYRDERKCEQKYGKYWKQYCKLVPFRLVPFMY